jgi:DNA-binding MurR/RpiR family transcriptional regulator
MLPVTGQRDTAVARKQRAMHNLTEDTTRSIPHGCLLKIKATYDSLKTAERKAVDYILQHPATLASMSIVDCAQASGASEATLVRVARKLGYDGFPAMKAEFQSTNTAGPSVVYKSITGDDDHYTVIQKVFESSIQALRDTLSLMDRATASRAIDAIVNAGRLFFCGLGDAGLVAMTAYQKFVRITSNCMASEDPDVQLIMASQLTAGDVMVAISHTGRSRTVLDAMKVAREKGATILAITNYPVSPMAKNADMVLLTADFAEHLNGEVVSKRVSELCVIEGLYINYVLAKGDAARLAHEESNRAVRFNKS